MKNIKWVVMISVMTVLFWGAILTNAFFKNNSSQNVIAEDNNSPSSLEEDSVQESESTDTISSEEEEVTEDASETSSAVVRQKKSLEILEELLAETSESPSKILDTEELLQNPELPTGCESISLTILLKYFGFDLKKTTIAEDYLVYGNNLAICYVGDPFSEDGAGVYPPGILRASKKFLKAQNSELSSIDTTGKDLSELCKIIDLGSPVLIWTTMYLEEPRFTGENTNFKNINYPWYVNEHCVVLYGYDREQNLVYINDPLIGKVTYRFDEFERIYREIGQFSMTVINIKNDF